MGEGGYLNMLMLFLYSFMSFPRRRESRKILLSYPEFISGSFSRDAEPSLQLSEVLERKRVLKP